MAKDKKDSYWFKHDFDSMNDLKMQSMMGEFGAAGFGLYWHIVECLHIENLHKLPFKSYVYEAFAKQMRANAKQIAANKFIIDVLPEDVEHFVKQCIKVHELFRSDEEFFWSERVNRNIDDKKKLSEIRSAAATSKN